MVVVSRVADVVLSFKENIIKFYDYGLLQDVNIFVCIKNMSKAVLHWLELFLILKIFDEIQ